MIKIAEKFQDDLETQTELKQRHIIRKEFWMKLIQHMNTKTALYQNISPSIYNWLGAGSGVRGIGLNFAISKAYGRAEVYIDRGDKAENEEIFDQLFAQKDELERVFGGALTWERLEAKRACRIKSEIDRNVWLFREVCGKLHGWYVGRIKTPIYRGTLILLT